MKHACILALVLLILLTGCGGGGNTTSSAPTSSASTSTGATAAPAANTLKGRVLDQHGKPISLPKTKITVQINGISEKSGERVNYSPPVKEDGSYEISLVEGNYHPVSATIQITWNSSTYRFDLDPVQDNTSDRSSKPGIVQNFVWKLNGPHFRYRDNPDPKNHTHWYGGSLIVRPSLWRNDLNRAAFKPVAGTKYVFTLKPEGKLIDGSDGKELKFERVIAANGELENQLLSDVPVAVYSLTGVEIDPSGASHTLIFETSYAKYAAVYPVPFEVDKISGGGPFVAQAAFDRQ